MKNSEANDPSALYIGAYARLYDNDTQGFEHRIISYTDGSTNPIPALLTISKLPIKFLAEEVFEVTPKTFSKYKKPLVVLPARMAETAFKLIELYGLGIEIFGDLHNFQSWMELPAYGLSDHVPARLLKTITGIEMITEELYRIAHGATA